MFRLNGSVEYVDTYVISSICDYVELSELHIDYMRRGERERERSYKFDSDMCDNVSKYQQDYSKRT